MNTNEIINLISLIAIVLIGFVLIVQTQIISKRATSTKKEANTEVKKLELILSQENIVDKIDGLVDDLIKKAANIYIILNFGFDKEKYIISTESEEMSLYIKAMVKKNITPEIRSLISLIRNIESEKDLDDYLDLKIKLYVIAVVVDKNQLIQ